MVTRLGWALLAGTALLLAPAQGLPAETSQWKPDVRGDTRRDERGSRPTDSHRHAPGAQRMPISPGWWWAPTAPTGPAPGPSLVIIQQAPGSVQADPPPPASEPPYYWYACGRGSTRPSPQAPASGYCIGGLTPSLLGRPGSGKTIEQFQADTARCQEWASAHAATLSGASGSMQGRYDSAYQQCLQAAGNQVPGVVGPGQAAYPPPAPPLR